MATDLVTGAFGFTGGRIAERLLANGRRVVTLTRRAPGTNPLEQRVERLPYLFDDASLGAALSGVDTVYVTYWMRFPRGDSTWSEMVANVGRLAAAAREAGVRRLVYVSVSSATADAPTAYFRAKAAAEDEIRGATRPQLTTAIVRPTLLYGPSDILINNMAWTLRRLPVFGIPGDGRYLVQPVLVDDVADLCLQLGATDETVERDAAGPEVLAFNDLVEVVRRAVGSRALLVHLPATMVLAATRLIGIAVHDVVLTGDEIRELSASLLVSASAPEGTCPTRFTNWIADHHAEIGRRWSSELERNFRRLQS